jgi:hypothetical protein
MNCPKIKLLAVSNVFTRLMHFEKAGDYEEGHYHTYDHGTLLSYGSIKVDMLDDNNNILSSKKFTAPSFVFISKDNCHKITALEDNTICACIHALKTIDDELIDPDFLIEEIECGSGEIKNKVMEKYNKEIKPFAQI